MSNNVKDQNRHIWRGEDLSTWSTEKLRRKAYQASDMAGLAVKDGDYKDAERHHEDFNRYQYEINTRSEEGQ